MHPYRLAKMASLVQNLIGEAIAHELNDPRISPLASVTRVEISGDMQIAKVHISVVGSEEETDRTVAALEHAAGHIQFLLSRRLQARHCPEVRFVSDPSIKVALQTIRIIEESVRADQERHLRTGGSETHPPTADPDGASA